MKNKRMLLLKTLLLSTSEINAYKYSKDKRRGKVIGNMIGKGIVGLMLIIYFGLAGVGMNALGYTDAVPTLCAMTVSAMGLFLTLLRSTGYMFAFKEYDMLMAMPFSVKDVVACKFLYMYIKSMPTLLCMVVPLYVTYGIYAKVGILLWVIGLFLLILLPVIPMIAATGIGSLIAKAGTGFKHKKLAQTIFTFIIVIPFFFTRFIVEKFAKDHQALEETVESIANFTGSSGKYYPLIRWFDLAVREKKILYAVLVVVATALIFEAFFYVLSIFYRRINSDLSKGGEHAKVKKNDYKKRSMVNAIAYKEVKRFLGSTAYSVNCGMGQILVVLIGVAALVVKADTLIQTVLQGAPVTKEMLVPAIPFIIYFMIGMVATTTCSPSLEGKNYWILQSLPIDTFDIYKGKMLFNIYATVPIALFGTLCLCISFRAGVIDSILNLLLITCLCMFSTAWGCVCGVKHMKLNWENEIEVIKQGAAVTIYMLPNMFACMILVVASVALSTMIDSKLVVIIFTAVALFLAALSYNKVKTLSRKTVG